jgi:hypothetical protein
MFDMNVFTPRFMHELTEVEKRRIIPSKMVMKMKYTAEGKEDRMKGRFAAGGHRQIQPEGTDNYSPTSDITSFFLLISIASKRKMHMMTTDVKGAYLQTSMPISGPKIHMRISNTIATKMVELDPTYASYRQPNGTVIVELDKALYRIKEAALLWYNNIKEKLTTYGFTTSNKDSCLFYKREANQKLTCLCLHVDDIFAIADDQEDLSKLEQYLKEVYTDITSNKGDIVEYLGMKIESNQAGCISISQRGYIDKIIDKYKVNKCSKYPADANLFNISSKQEDNLPCDTTEFQGKVMSCLYLTKRSLPTILTAVSFLTTRLVKPEKDRSSLTIYKTK